VAVVCGIPKVAARPDDLAGRVDAVLLTEGAGNRHLELSAPFLELGLPLFIDKPLAGSWEDVREIWRRTGPEYPVLCCSNLRYNPELPEFRRRAQSIGEPVLLRGLTAMDWTGYGWHLAELLVALWGRRATSVRALDAPRALELVEWRDGAGNVHAVEAGDWTVEVAYPDRRRALLQVSYPMDRVLSVSLHGTAGHLEVPIQDYFTMMRGLLDDLAAMFRSKRPPRGIMEDTLEVSRIVTGAVLSRERGGAPVALGDLAL
jgi:predicted dehydrogenase